MHMLVTNEHRCRTYTYDNNVQIANKSMNAKVKSIIIYKVLTNTR